MFGRITRMAFLKRILVYVVTLPFSILLVAVAWLFLAPERLYHCWDDAPPFLISWYPPFIHPESNSLDGNLRDYYLWPEWTVYCIWFSFVGLAFLLPAFVAWQFGRAAVRGSFLVK